MIEQNPSCFNCINSNCLIKKYCPSDIMEEVISKKSTKKIQKKQRIFLENDFVDRTYFIHSGIVKVYKDGAFNKNQTIRLSTNGEILGHRGLSNNQQHYPISANVISDNAIICFFEKSFFISLIEQSHKLAINLMFLFANELNTEEARLRDMSVFNVREKVAKALLILIEKLGLNYQLEINGIEDLNRQDIAELVGLNSNQVTKVLAEFKADKIIETDNKKIKIINQKKLEEIISF